MLLLFHSSLELTFFYHFILCIYHLLFPMVRLEQITVSPCVNVRIANSIILFGDRFCAAHKSCFGFPIFCCRPPSVAPSAIWMTTPIYARKALALKQGEKILSFRRRQKKKKEIESVQKKKHFLFLFFSLLSQTPNESAYRTFAAVDKKKKRKQKTTAVANQAFFVFVFCLNQETI